MNEIPTVPRPQRPGLPVDPLLQLWAGDAARLPNVTIPASLTVQVCVSNPMRVLLMVAPVNTISAWTIAPAPDITPTPFVGFWGNVPFSIHCRDYPGFVQGEWWITGGLGDTFAVWEYTLSDQWG